MKRAPDFIIGTPGDPYLLRWYLLPRNRLFNVYLHRFCRSDDDRALHSHPWLFNASILIHGRYLEHTVTSSRVRSAPAIKVRWGASFHRVELIDGKPATTIFITGPKIREWFFRCPQGLVHWKDFVSGGPGTGGSQTGKGCAQ